MMPSKACLTSVGWFLLLVVDKDPIRRAYAVIENKVSLFVRYGVRSYLFWIMEMNKGSANPRFWFQTRDA